MSYTFQAFVLVPPSNNPDNNYHTLVAVVPGDLITVTISGAFFDTDDPFPFLEAEIALTAQYGPLPPGPIVWSDTTVNTSRPGPFTSTWLVDVNPQQVSGGVWPWQIYGTDYVDPAYSLYPGLDAHVMVQPGTPLQLQFDVVNSFIFDNKPPVPWIAKVVVTIDNVARTEPPELPPNFTPEQKQAFQDAADSLNKIAGGLSALAAATDPLRPELMLATNLASQLASAIDSHVGTVNSAVQTALSMAKSAIEASPGLNPIGLTLGLSAMTDRLAAKILSILANDPPDGNFTEVYAAPDWNLGPVSGASTASYTLITATWALFKDVVNMLAAAERYQGADLAGDDLNKTLQNAAFDGALANYQTHKLALATALNDYLAEIQSTVSDLDLSTDPSVAALQDYIESLTNPVADDPFLAALIDYIDADRPYLTSTTTADVQQAIAALLGMGPGGQSGSAFAALAAAADELAGIDTTSVTPVLTGITTDSGPSATDEITSDNTPTINGTAEAGATVEVFRGATSLGTTTANGSGQWSFTDPTTLADGTYSYTAIATDISSNISDPSVALSVTIDTTNPAVPTDSNAATNTVAENAANGTTVGVTAASTDANGVTYSLTDNAGGRFAIDPVTGVVTVANGSLLDFETATSHSVTARATDAAGNVADQSFVIAVSDVLEINQVLGTTGNDKNILGTAGADRIDGLAGKDKMTGFGGDDTYVVDNKSDKVVEAPGGGIDTVESSVTVKLAANVENLILTGNAAINATGNDLDNVITGNAANNTLDGGKRGNDTFVFSGVFGNDTIKGFVGNGAALGDTIQFDHSIFADADAVIAATTDTGKNLFIDAGAFGTITLLKVADVSLLHPSDFTFV